MKERPILFNGEMVRAILDGRKTQTRRLVKDKHGPFDDIQHWQPALGMERGFYGINANGHHHLRCPYGQSRDRLWVRETWKAFEAGTGRDGILYRADHGFKAIDNTPEAAEAWVIANTPNGKWRPSIFMPRWASRLTLEITNVRVERLQDISEYDARAEGITDGGCTECGEHEPCGCSNPSPDARDSFIWLWQSINGADSWSANPWVWVIEFKPVQP